MGKIKVIHFQHLRNEAHYEFLWIFNHLVEEYSAVKTLLAGLLDAFLVLLAKEKRLLDAARTSALTKQIADADHRVDRAVSGLKAVINAARYSLDATVAEAARALYLRLREFGNIRRKAYEEESAAVQVLLSDLGNAYAQQVSTLGLHEWMMELMEAEAAFTRVYLQRGDETAIRPQERMVDVRRDIEASYHDMVTLIVASSIVNTSGVYEEFIAKLNAQVAYFSEHNHIHARKDISVGNRCVVEAIDAQLHTGKAITPIPKVSYREKGKPSVELVFTEHFTVTYRNNKNVGMASVIIRGKGAYKGQKTVTFTIAK
jgi:broad specificity phosphatase PhoE